MLRLWDTTDEQGYTRLRPLWYPQTNVFLVCFSIASPGSFELVGEKWLPQVRYMCPGVPCLIVGTKTDLRDDPSTKRKLAKMKMQPVRYKDGVRMAKGLGLQYVECSALTQDGLNDVFDQVNSQSHQLDCLHSNNPYLGHNCCSTASNASEEISV
jgi:cell division control protein 42